MEVRRFFILETLLSNGNSTESQVMCRLWDLDHPNRDNREEPWKFYYNTTKCFAPMDEHNAWIACMNPDVASKSVPKIWEITDEGVEAFSDALKDGEILSDPLYVGSEKRLKQLLRKVL